MRKLFYAFLGLLFAICMSSDGAKAQTITYYNIMSNLCYFAPDSVTIDVNGATGSETIEMSYGDGTMDTHPPAYYSSGMDYFSFAHNYTTVGTYSVKIVVISGGGVRTDSVSFVHTTTYCYEMRISTFFDLNADCVEDPSDFTLTSPATIEIDSATYPIDTVTTVWGMYYDALGPLSTAYTFKVISNPYGLMPSCPASGIVYDTTSYVVDTFHRIAFVCDPSVAVDNKLTWAFSSCGVNGEYMDFGITTSSCTATTLTVTITHSPKYSLTHLWDMYGAIYPCTVTGNIITLTVPGVSASTPKHFSALYAPVGTLTLGDTAMTTITVSPTADHDPTNNVYSSIDTIRASYDPNDKVVQPEGIVAAGTNLKYLINFENTGNDTAHNIHVQDTLSDNVDVSTIQISGSSAKVVMSLSRYGSHNVVKFDFPGINLLDSSHHGQCDGFVKFSVNCKTGLANGTKIDNRAGIYFDINPVVMTNTVENVIGVLAAESIIGNISNIALYPNPVTDALTVEMEKGAYNTATITNTLGQVMMTQDVDGAQAQVHVAVLPAGIYFITLKGANGVKVQEFEKR